MSNEQENDSPDPQALIIADIMGRILAMQSLVTRLVASHAQMFPDGIGARMLQNIDEMVEGVDNSLGPGIVNDAIKLYLRDYLEKAQDALDLGIAANLED